MPDKVTTRPATAADLKEFYPEETCSFRAWVAELDGKPEGIIGLALTRPIRCMFSAFREPLRPHLKAIAVLKLIKRAEAAVKGGRVPVIALAETSEPTAPDILQRIGFRHLGRSDDGELYGWGV